MPSRIREAHLFTSSPRPRGTGFLEAGWKSWCRNWMIGILETCPRDMILEYVMEIFFDDLGTKLLQTESLPFFCLAACFYLQSRNLAVFLPTSHTSTSSQRNFFKTSITQTLIKGPTDPSGPCQMRFGIPCWKLRLDTFFSVPHPFQRGHPFHTLAQASYPTQALLRVTPWLSIQTLNDPSNP
ncbi:hypothetical protein D9758_017877 [Tetrapyrgos nigripes]|uniref:Uncharacterized protein n=1 Tax=Tetrapyrgos nigripes TaxID=182062 RepID=A0A8H5BBJ8_9AGAR|nr:hypothetical protein D9758_017877 [Tetrapyrgos nigripes]